MVDPSHLNKAQNGLGKRFEDEFLRGLQLIVDSQDIAPGSNNIDISNIKRATGTILVNNFISYFNQVLQE